MNTARDYIDHHAEHSADKVFLITPDENGQPDGQLTFSELKKGVDRVGRKLDESGIERGSKVAFLMNNGQWSVLSFLGVMANGRVIVPLNAVAGQTQLLHVLSHCDAEIVLVAPEYRELVDGLISEIDRTIEVIDVDPRRGPLWASSENSLSASQSSLDHKPVADDHALLLYTSGSTGLPKGALLSQRAIVSGGRNVMQGHGLSGDDRALCVLPVYHINGAMVTVAAPLVSGSSVVMPERFSVQMYWQLVATFQCTWSSICLLYTSPSPRDGLLSRMPSSA